MNYTAFFQAVGCVIMTVLWFYLSAWLAGVWMREYWKHRGPTNINVNWNPIVQMKTAPKDSPEGKET